MKLKHHYKVSGNAKIGHRVAVPSVLGWKTGDSLECEVIEDGGAVVFRKVKK